MTAPVPDNFAAWLLETGGRDALALEHGSRRVTYGELRERVAEVAGALADLGERPIVPVTGEMSVELVIAYLGALYAGAVPTPLASPTEAMLRGVVEETSAPLTLVANELPIAAAVPPTRVSPDALAALMYTSGSTGRPRGVMVSTRNLWSNTCAILDAIPLTDADRGLVALPLYYCYGASVVHTHLRAGATLVLAADSMPSDLLDGLASGATGFAAVPSMIQMLVTRTAIATTPLPSLRYVMVSGGRLAERTLRELRAAVPNTRVYVRYGVTELTAAASFLPAEHVDDHPGSIGRGVPGTPLRVEREDGTEVSRGSGEIGEIVGRGTHVALGYVAAPDETARAFRGGAFYTGDLATVDADGFITITSRVKDFVKTGGHRVAPQEIEDVLMLLDGVSAAAACGLPHPMRGEAIVAAVVLRDGATLTEAELRGHCASRLPAHKIPTLFRIVSSLPRRPNGKLDRHALATELLA